MFNVLRMLILEKCALKTTQKPVYPAVKRPYTEGTNLRFLKISNTVRTSAHELD